MTLQRHTNCDKDRCSICLEDCEVLETELAERTGLEKKYCDHLGEYRTWLDRNNIPAETEHGWFTEEVFDEENINNYVTEWLS